MNEVAELLLECGFSLTDTGGGIEQWLSHDERTGRYTIVTDEQGEQPVDASAPVTVGFYDGSGEVIESTRFESLQGFLQSLNQPSTGPTSPNPDYAAEQLRNAGKALSQSGGKDKVDYAYDRIVAIREQDCLDAGTWKKVNAAQETLRGARGRNMDTELAKTLSGELYSLAREIESNQAKLGA